MPDRFPRHEPLEHRGIEVIGLKTSDRHDVGQVASSEVEKGSLGLRMVLLTGKQTPDVVHPRAPSNRR